MKVFRRTWRMAGLAVFAIVTLPAAASVVDFSIDTSNLAGGGWALQFQLTNGNAGVNSVTLTNFAFGGGSAAGSPTLQGGATGSLAAGVTLADNGGFLALFTEGFTPGTTLTFRTDSTTSFSGGAPDFFGMAILLNGTPLDTAHVADQLIAVSIMDPLDIQTFAVANPRIPGDVIPAPTFQPGGTNPVPEPATFVSVLVPLAALAVRRRARS